MVLRRSDFHGGRFFDQGPGRVIGGDRIRYLRAHRWEPEGSLDSIEPGPIGSQSRPAGMISAGVDPAGAVMLSNAWSNSAETTRVGFRGQRIQ